MHATLLPKCLLSINMPDTDCAIPMHPEPWLCHSNAERGIRSKRGEEPRSGEGKYASPVEGGQWTGIAGGVCKNSAGEVEVERHLSYGTHDPLVGSRGKVELGCLIHISARGSQRCPSNSVPTRDCSPYSSTSMRSYAYGTCAFTPSYMVTRNG